MFKKETSIKNRIFKSTFTLIFLVFGTIILIFNISINAYIQSTAEEQLKAIDNAKNEILIDYNTIEIIQEVQDTLSTIRPQTNNVKTETKFFIIKSDYEIVQSNQIEEANLIVEKIKNKGLDLKHINKVHIKTNSGSYYITAYNMQGYEDCYICLYVDVTSITSFAGIINTVLIMTIGIAMLFTIIITAILSERITKPIKQLRGVAAQLGEGDFAGAQKDLNLKEEELRELSETMSKAAKQLEIYDKDQKVFFQNASHELRTPLMSIKCYAEGIQYGIMDKDKAVNTIISEVTRMSEMVEDLLYVSRIDNITKPYEVSKYDLREIISTCAGRQKPIAENEGVTFDFQFDEKELLFKCNDKLIGRAFTNLISNAIRHADKYVTLVCKKEKDLIKVSVIDDGEGITEEDLPHIFERFYKGKNGNHGIGLSIAKAIVEQHKGVIYAQNADEGTKFTIEFKI